MICLRFTGTTASPNPAPINLLEVSAAFVRLGRGQDLFCCEKCGPALKDRALRVPSGLCSRSGVSRAICVHHTQPLLELWDLAVMVSLVLFSCLGWGSPGWKEWLIIFLHMTVTLFSLQSCFFSQIYPGVRGESQNLMGFCGESLGQQAGKDLGVAADPWEQPMNTR